MHPARFGNSTRRNWIGSLSRAGQIVGIREVDDRIWPVSFLDYDLGFVEQDEGSIEPGVSRAG